MGEEGRETHLHMADGAPLHLLVDINAGGILTGEVPGGHSCLSLLLFQLLIVAP